MQNLLQDSFGRIIDYVRISVTDRCNLRCMYCMAESMQFIPKDYILTLEEILRIVKIFTQLGVTKLRLTGGEPLIRQGIVSLCEQIKAETNIVELNITTNATYLKQYAKSLKAAGIDRINVSLDSLNADTFKRITRVGNLNDTIDGILLAKQIGFPVRLNSVIMGTINKDEIISLFEFASLHELDICFIEEMPLGIVDRSRSVDHVSCYMIQQIIQSKYTLHDIQSRTNGPAHYMQSVNHTTKVGFVSPLSCNFCASCNRVRLTAEGKLLLCLGQDNSVDLREPLRNGSCDQYIQDIIQQAIYNKPEKHDFSLDEQVKILRFMNTTGG